MSYTPKKGSKTSAILDFIYQNAGATTEVIAREFRVPPSKVCSMLELAIKGGAVEVAKTTCANGITPQNYYTTAKQEVHTPKSVWDVKLDSLKAYEKQKKE